MCPKLNRYFDHTRALFCLPILSSPILFNVVHPFVMQHRFEFILKQICIVHGRVECRRQSFLNFEN